MTSDLQGWLDRVELRHERSSGIPYLYYVWVCDGTVSRQVGKVPEGAADSQNPADDKQFATAGQEYAAG